MLFSFPVATTESTNSVLTYTRPLVRLQVVPDVTPAYGAVLCVLAGVLAASVAMVTSYCRVNNMQPRYTLTVHYLRLTVGV